MKIKNVIKILLMILFSPTFYFYEFLKKKGNSKKYKGVLADNIKRFYLVVCFFILSTIGIYEFLNYKIYNNLNIYGLKISERYIVLILSMVSLVFSIFFIYKINKTREKKEINKYINCMMFVLGFVAVVCICSIFIKSYENIFGIIAMYYFGISRVVHFFLNFIGDIFKNNNQDEKKSNQGKNKLSIDEKKQRKLYYVLMSYVSLLIEYGVLYYLLDKCGEKMFSNSLVSILNSIYYSVVTITTIGYGEYFPTNVISRIYVVLQIVSGMFLLGVSLATYMNQEEKGKLKIKE